MSMSFKTRTAKNVSADQADLSMACKRRKQQKMANNYVHRITAVPYALKLQWQENLVLKQLIANSNLKICYQLFLKHWVWLQHVAPQWGGILVETNAILLDGAHLTPAMNLTLGVLIVKDHNAPCKLI